MQKQGRDIPMVICDICNTWIENAGEAVAVWKAAQNDGEMSDVLHVHKRGCHNEAEHMLGGRQSCSWEELSCHILYLASNTDLPPEKLSEIQNQN